MHSQRKHRGSRRVTTVFAGLIFALCLFIPAAAFADVDHYVVGVNGMACPFCAYGIEKKLEGLDGVDQVEVHLKQGEVDVPVAHATVTPAQIDNAIEKAGFEVRDLSVSGTGTIATKGTPTISFSPDLQPALRNYTGKAGKFQVSGKLAKTSAGWVLEVSDAREPK